MPDPDFTPDRRNFITGQLAREQIERHMAKRDGQAPHDTHADEPAEELLQHFSHRAMACDFQLFFPLDSAPHPGDAALAAFAEIDRIEALLSIYRPDSEVTRINLAAAERLTAVSAETNEIIATALQVFRDTNGAFDFTATPLSRVWGFLDRKPRYPAASELASAREKVSSSLVQHDPGRQIVRFTKPGVEINFNSLGKGYALEQAANQLQRRNVDRLIIHGGQSSVLARTGRQQDSTAATSAPMAPWRIALTNPLIPGERLGIVELSDQALSTSGSARQVFFHQGKRLGHIIDPRQGTPADSFLSVTVIHQNAALSDALATALFAMSRDELAQFAEANRDVGVLAVLPHRHPRFPLKVQTWNLEPGQFLPEAEELLASGGLEKNDRSAAD